MLGARIAIVGVAVLVGAVISLMIPLSPTSATEALLASRIYLVSWFFVVFGAILIVMGIRRIRPVPEVAR